MEFNSEKFTSLDICNVNRKTSSETKVYSVEEKTERLCKLVHSTLNADQVYVNDELYSTLFIFPVWKNEIYQ